MVYTSMLGHVTETNTYKQLAMVRLTQFAARSRVTSATHAEDADRLAVAGSMAATRSPRAVSSDRLGRDHQVYGPNKPLWFWYT